MAIRYVGDTLVYSSFWLRYIMFHSHAYMAKASNRIIDLLSTVAQIHVSGRNVDPHPSDFRRRQCSAWSFWLLRGANGPTSARLGLLLLESSCNVQAQPLPCGDAPSSGVRRLLQVLPPRELVCSARNRRCRWSFEAFAIYPSDHRILGIVAPGKMACLR